MLVFVSVEKQVTQLFM